MKTTTLFTRITGGLLMLLVLSAAMQNTEAQTKPDIFHYIMTSDVEGLEAALLNGEDVNQQSKVGNTPLMVAAKIGDVSILRALISNNADVNLRNQAGATALMIAAKYDFPHYVLELLNHGADPTIKTNRGYTAATFALGYKRYKIYDQLKEAEKNFKIYADKK